jgi:hypothetical protein
MLKKKEAVSMFLLHMARFPGSGKSTLDKGISNQINLLEIESYIENALDYIELRGDFYGIR